MIYLDYAATTPVLPQAVQAAVTAMETGWGNPSSQYAHGKAARDALAHHRAAAAAALDCAPEEVVFTSCGTEGDNWAIRAALHLGRHTGKHIVTTAIEHAAVLEPIKALERQGYTVTYLPPDQTGHIAPAQVKSALRPDTVLVSMMLVNNELGALLPVKETAAAIRETGCPALLHCDAIQALGKVPCAPKDLGVDLLTLSGHKIGAPKGVGALYIRRGLAVQPLLLGGGQENGLRPGTEPTAQIAAFAAALSHWKEMGPTYRARMAESKAAFLTQLVQKLPGAQVVSPGDAPHICAVSLPGYPSEMLVRELAARGICVSAGSACHRGKPSHVYAALKLPKRTLMGVLRFSFGPQTTPEEVQTAVTALYETARTRMSL